MATSAVVPEKEKKLGHCMTNYSSILAPSGFLHFQILYQFASRLRLEKNNLYCIPYEFITGSLHEIFVSHEHLFNQLVEESTVKCAQRPYHILIYR